MNFLFYAKSLKGEVVKGAYISAACSHTGKHYIVDTNKNYNEIDPESLGLKLPYRFIAEDRICSYAKVIMVKRNNNFDIVTESPEKLAEFIDKIICHCSDHDKDCTECPMKENRNCDYETTLEWLMEKCNE